MHSNLTIQFSLSSISTLESYVSLQQRQEGDFPLGMETSDCLIIHVIAWWS